MKTFTLIAWLCINGQPVPAPLTRDLTYSECYSIARRTLTVELGSEYDLVPLQCIEERTS